ncbi:SNF2-related protein [Streptosporangium sp. NBC_01755]|uniref:SNF2-related protein n=1 Tax=Streptosporangium sp. NBC_01755 TaxID=2975949 RepID=UPI003FA3B479
MDRTSPTRRTSDSSRDRLNTVRPTRPAQTRGNITGHLVVVDEAHSLRNANTRRAEALRRLPPGSPPKRLVMLTATPVNNSLYDLYDLISYALSASSPRRTMNDNPTAPGMIIYRQAPGGPVVPRWWKRADGRDRLRRRRRARPPGPR